MSAWYIFGALGFYPVCPGDPNYIIGSPLFDKATLHLPNGKTFSITAKENGPQHFYISGAELNGQPFNQTWLSHEELMKGGELLFKLTSTPNYQVGGSAGRSPTFRSLGAQRRKHGKSG